MSSLSISSEQIGDLHLLRLTGRLDAHGAQQVEPAFTVLDARSLVLLDLTGVSYLSSGGIRLFVALQKKLNAQSGRLVIAGLQPYCREVLRVSGLDQFFSLSATVEEATQELSPGQKTFDHPVGRFTFQHGSDEAGCIEVLGRIQNVLEASVTPDIVWSKKFSAKEYSIGLGGLGPSVEDVMLLMGEMMTIGGTMVWLPTDGNDTPDFLVPRHDSDAVVIRTGFNASIAGKFNEYVEFDAAAEGGATLGDIYAALFDLARRRRPDFRGALGIAMRAEVGQVYGCGVVKAPVASQAPANGKPITDPSNYAEWFEVDETPRHQNVTGLICGIGVDLEIDLSSYNQEYLSAAFYINPGNKPDGRVKLHNHGVFFKPCPLGEKPWSLEREIQSVVTDGDFVDMRHLFDKTTVDWAIIGIVYIQDFAPDPALAQGA